MLVAHLGSHQLMSCMMPLASACAEKDMYCTDIFTSVTWDNQCTTCTSLTTCTCSSHTTYRSYTLTCPFSNSILFCPLSILWPMVPATQ